MSSSVGQEFPTLDRLASLSDCSGVQLSIGAPKSRLQTSDFRLRASKTLQSLQIRALEASRAKIRRVVECLSRRKLDCHSGSNFSSSSNSSSHSDSNSNSKSNSIPDSFAFFLSLLPSFLPLFPFPSYSLERPKFFPFQFHLLACWSRHFRYLSASAFGGFNPGETQQVESSPLARHLHRFFVSRRR